LCGVGAIESPPAILTDINTRSSSTSPSATGAMIVIVMRGVATVLSWVVGFAASWWMGKRMGKRLASSIASVASVATTAPRTATAAQMPAGWEAAVPAFVDAASVTPDQAFALMLAKRIEDLESVSDRLKKAIGLDRPPPVPRIPDIPDIPIPIPIPGLMELTQRVENLVAGLKQDALVAERVSAGESVPELRDVLTLAERRELRTVTTISRCVANYFHPYASRTAKDKLDILETVNTFLRTDTVPNAEVVAWIDRQLDRVF
jgi:hypothetical protein